MKSVGRYLLRKKSSRRSKPVLNGGTVLSFEEVILFNCAFLISDMVFLCVFLFTGYHWLGLLL